MRNNWDNPKHTAHTECAKKAALARPMERINFQISKAKALAFKQACLEASVESESRITMTSVMLKAIDNFIKKNK